MRIYRPIAATLFALFTCLNGFSQDTLRLTPDEAEGIFLSENLMLIAERMEVPMAEAMETQASLWPNPTMTVEQVNLWTNSRQTGGETVVPPLWKNFGRNQQFAIELEQWIITAGKRKKQIGLEKLNVQKARNHFEEVLRQAKLDFRQTLTSLLFLQHMHRMMNEQLQSLRTIIAVYVSQVEQGNIPKSEWVRLKAEEIEMAQELNEIGRDIQGVQEKLRLWMHLAPESVIQIDDATFGELHQSSAKLTADSLLQLALQKRPDLRSSQAERAYRSNLYELERANRIPDLALKAYYDRGGGIVTNFVGFGVAIDLPLFNRNQGNIQAARIGMEQSQTAHQHLEKTIEAEIRAAVRNYIAAADFRNSIEEGYIGILNDMLEAYTRNFRQKNIALIQYIDFLEAYISTHKSILNAVRSVRDAAEELNYYAGADVITF